MAFQPFKDLNDILFFKINIRNTQIKGFCAYTGIELVGIITANGAENKSAAKLDEVKAFAKAL